MWGTCICMSLATRKTFHAQNAKEIEERVFPLATEIQTEPKPKIWP